MPGNKLILQLIKLALLANELKLIGNGISPLKQGIDEFQILVDNSMNSKDVTVKIETKTKRWGPE